MIDGWSKQKSFRRHSNALKHILFMNTLKIIPKSSKRWTVTLVLYWQWLTGIGRVTPKSQTWDIWKFRPPVMSTFPWALCGWDGSGRSSQEFVRATGRSKHILSHTQKHTCSLQEQPSNTLTVNHPVSVSAVINFPGFQWAGEHPLTHRWPSVGDKEHEWKSQYFYTFTN